MNVLEAIILGAVQGLTEFLPVSSSGHLVLAKELFGVETGDQSVAIAVLVHLGSLVAIGMVFRRDVFTLMKPSQGWRNWLVLVIATLPAAVGGIGFKMYAPELFERYESSAWVACFGLLVTCMLLAVVTIRTRRKRAEAEGGEQDLEAGSELRPQWGRAGSVELKSAFGVGVAQMVAITPGISRSGSTICASLLLGWSRADALRLSFLMGMIAIGGAGLLEARNISELEPVSAVTAFLSSLVFSLLGIWAIKAIVAKAKFGWFAVYTGCAGVVGLVWLGLK